VLANTIIKAALRKVLIRDGSVTPSTQEFADGLEVLNDMINSWSAQYNMVYEDTVEDLTIPSSTQSITIGATGTLVTARPLSIKIATLKSGNTEYPMRIIDEVQYSRYTDKTSGGQPNTIYYRNTFPNGTIYFELTTNVTYTLKLTSMKYLGEFADGTTDNPLPPHYEAALKANLVLALADEMGRGASITPMMVESAKETKQTIIGQALDLNPSTMEISRGSLYNIEGDSY